MFPALTSEFIRAENHYRHDRAQHALRIRHAVRTSRARRAAGGGPWPLRPTVDAAAWRPRSA